MADARALHDEPAYGVLRARRAARRRGDDHARSLPVEHRVTVYSAGHCSLCARALEVVEAVRADLGFDVQVIDIEGDDDLEGRYRELLPVVEIDGKRAFTYFVDEDALRALLES